MYQILTFFTFFYFAAKSGTIVLITNVRTEKQKKQNQTNVIVVGTIFIPNSIA